MAYIPDDCIDDAPELSGPAWLLFCHLCRRRNHKQRRVFINIKRMQAILGVSKSSLYRSLSELEKKHWTRRSGSELEILRGNFDPVDKRFYESQKWENDSRSTDSNSRKVGNDIISSLPADLNQNTSPSVAAEASAATGEESNEGKAFAERWNAYKCKRCFDTGLITNARLKQSMRCDDQHCTAGKGAREKPLADQHHATS